MTWMAGSIPLSLSVGLLGYVGTSRLGHNTHLTPATHTGARPKTELAEHITAGQR